MEVVRVMLVFMVFEVIVVSLVIIVMLVVMVLKVVMKSVMINHCFITKNTLNFNIISVAG